MISRSCVAANTVVVMLAGIVSLSISTPLIAQAQPASSFDELRFFSKPGDRITIREAVCSVA
jgi:hypothetical protein